MEDEIIIRAAKVEDAAQILKIYAYYVEHTAISFEWEVPTLENFVERIKKFPPNILTLSPSVTEKLSATLTHINLLTERLIIGVSS